VRVSRINGIYDAATGLTWQQSGSKNYMTFENSESYIQQINSEKHGDFEDWRLPTLEEAMSLMEPNQKEQGLFIDSVFDKTQRIIWTSDKESASFAWVVYFYNGSCPNLRIPFNLFFVRAVR